MQQSVQASDAATEDPLPPLSQVVSTPSKFESARETRRQARRKLLEKMEEEGKLKHEPEIVKALEETEKVEVNDQIVPKKKTRRRKVDIDIIILSYLKKYDVNLTCMTKLNICRLL